jgi:hypothetical protein
LALFGSSSKGVFCYARVGGQLRLQSDVEFNVFVDQDDPDAHRGVADLVAPVVRFIGKNQPLFDIDARVRTKESITDLTYNRVYRRELFCHSATSGIDFSEIPCSETDSVALGDCDAILLSALEWLLLRLVHTNRLQSQPWWESATCASFICKLAPLWSAVAGVPFVGMPADATNLLRAGDTNGHILRAAWQARQDVTGSAIAGFGIKIANVLNGPLESILGATPPDRSASRVRKEILNLAVFIRSTHGGRDFARIGTKMLRNEVAAMRPLDSNRAIKYERHLALRSDA